MTLSNLEQIVGPVSRGQLAGGFKSSYEPALEEVPAYFSESRAMYRPPLDDMSHLNGKTTKKYSDIAKGFWKRITPEERKKRLEHLSKAGKEGGLSAKNMRHLK